MESISAVVEKYKIAKTTVISQCKGKSGGKKLLFKYHTEEQQIEKDYIKNKTCGKKLFYIYDLNRILLTKVKFKKDVIFYLTNSTKRNGTIERKLKQCVDNNETICLYEKYIIEFKNALDSSNVIDESGQPNI